MNDPPSMTGCFQRNYPNPGPNKSGDSPTARRVGKVSHLVPGWEINSWLGSWHWWRGGKGLKKRVCLNDEEKGEESIYLHIYILRSENSGLQGTKWWCFRSFFVLRSKPTKSLKPRIGSNLGPGFEANPAGICTQKYPPWKLMVWIWNFLFGMAYFQGWNLSFMESIFKSGRNMFEPVAFQDCFEI